jgi:hypothetical protein
MIRVTARLSRVLCAISFVSGVAAISTAAIAGGAAYLKIGDIKGESSNSKHEGEIAIESWSWGSARGGASKVDSLTVKQGTARTEHEVEMDVHVGKAPDEAETRLKAQPKTTRSKGDIRLKRGVSETAGRGRAAPAPGAGSVRITTAARWSGCRVGARYPVLELGDSDSRYRLIDATVTGCATATDSIPTEEISFVFTKIE